jgi:hypothetical protein
MSPGRDAYLWRSVVSIALAPAESATCIGQNRFDALGVPSGGESAQTPYRQVVPESKMPESTKKTSIARIAFLVLATIAAFIVLRFVFSVTMTLLKYGIIAALAVFVVWLFLGRQRAERSEESDRKR